MQSLIKIINFDLNRGISKWTTWVVLQLQQLKSFLSEIVTLAGVVPGINTHNTSVISEFLIVSLEKTCQKLRLLASSQAPNTSND